MNVANVAMNDQHSDAGNARAYVDPDATQGERMFSLWTHLAGLLTIPTASLPIAGLIVTLIMWRARSTESAFLDDHGREAVNFQISLGAYWVGGMLLGIFLGIVTLGIAAPLIALGGLVGPVALTILTGVGCVRGAIAAHKGEYYRYPMCFRFITDSGERKA